MTLEQLQAEWALDCKMDTTNLELEAANISTLHNKYYSLFSRENLALAKLKAVYKQLYLDMFEFITIGHEEGVAKGYKMPAKGKVLKSEADRYVEGSKEIVELSLKISYQSEKVDFLQSIINRVSNRSFDVRAAVDFLKFKAGIGGA